MDKRKVTFHLVYGILLLLFGAMMLIRIPENMSKIEGILPPSGLIFGRISLYLIGGLLIVGGVKKIFSNYRLLKAEEQHS